MSSSPGRLECLGKSSPGSKKQPAGEVTSAHAKTHKLNDTLRKKTVTDKPRSLPAHALPSSMQETPKSGSANWDVLNTEVCAPKESINVTPRVEEQAESAAVSGEELKMKAQPSAVADELLPMHEVNEDEDRKAPVELIIEFLTAVMGRHFQLASKLCEMILIYEPDNPEASEFHSLIRKKLQEEQEEEESSEEEEEEDEDEDDDDDDSDETESEEESSDSSSSSSSSCSSSSPSDYDEEEEKQVDRHKPCPLSHISK